MALAGRRDVDLPAQDLGFLDRLLRPDAGEQIVGGAVVREQVHRHHRELQRGAALKEQHPVAVGDPGQLAARRFGLIEDLLEHLAAVAVLHDPDPATGNVPDRLLRLPKHGLGKNRGAGAEVIDALAHISLNSTLMMSRVAGTNAVEGARLGSPSRWIRASVAWAPW